LRRAWNSECYSIAIITMAAAYHRTSTQPGHRTLPSTVRGSPKLYG
jgi:hypothetical protein